MFSMHLQTGRQTCLLFMNISHVNHLIHNLAKLAYSCIFFAIAVHGQTNSICWSDTNSFQTSKIFGEDYLTEPYEYQYRNHKKLYNIHKDEISERSIRVNDAGFITNNLELFIRFTQNEYTIGEPIIAIIALRNLAYSPKQITRWQPDKSSYDYYVNYKTNVYMWTKPPKLPHASLFGGQSSGIESYEMPPHSQIVTIVDIGKMIEIKQTGSYSVQIRYRDLSPSGMETTNLLSNLSRFNIVESLSPFEIDARKAQHDLDEDIDRRVKDKEMHLHVP